MRSIRWSVALLAIVMVGTSAAPAFCWGFFDYRCSVDPFPRDASPCRLQVERDLHFAFHHLTREEAHDLWYAEKRSVRPHGAFRTEPSAPNSDEFDSKEPRLHRSDTERRSD